MKLIPLATLGCSLLLAASPALAETASGWLTYMAEDGRHLMLNSQDMYKVDCKCLQTVHLGDHVQIVWQQRGPDKSITSIDRLTP